MTTTDTGYLHIKLDEHGTLTVAGTAYKVIPLLEHFQAARWSPEQFREQYPDLTPDQVHALLEYYHDHAEQVDQEIARRRELVEQLRREAAPSPALERLRAIRRERAVE